VAEFRTITNRRWHEDNVVLLGDSAHTAPHGATTRQRLGSQFRRLDCRQFEVIAATARLAWSEAVCAERLGADETLEAFAAYCALLSRN
jgi:hypothetical protein